LERADEFPAPRAGAGKRKRKQFQTSNFRSELPFDETHVSSARTFLGFLDRELDALAFPEQLEHRATHRAAVKEMLQAGFITDEPEALVD
jgi:hypothetical protein